MRRFFLATVAALAASAWPTQAADPSASGQTADTESAQAGRVLPPKPYGSDADPNTHPWNPDVLHSDVFPYDKPLQVPTNFCGPPGSFWLTAEFLLWSIKGEHLPPLLAASIPGRPGTEIVLGANTINPSPYYGGRFTGGVWIDNDYTWAFEGGYFFLADQSVRPQAASTGRPGTPDLAQPYLDLHTGQLRTSPIASAGVASGYMVVVAPTEFQGAEGNFVWNFRRTKAYSVDLLGGFRYQDLGGDLTIASGTTAISGKTAGTSTTVFDQFGARNRFFGGQVGIRGTYRWRQLVLGMTKKIALGGNAEDINIVGFTTTHDGTHSGGLLTGRGNIGSHSHPTFSMVDELGFNVGWQICDYVQLFAGYTLILQTAVIRPPDLVDVGVDSAPAPGTPFRPAFVTHNSDFWAQGLNLGLEIRY